MARMLPKVAHERDCHRAPGARRNRGLAANIDAAENPSESRGQLGSEARYLLCSTCSSLVLVRERLRWNCINQTCGLQSGPTVKDRQRARFAERRGIYNPKEIMDTD